MPSALSALSIRLSAAQPEGKMRGAAKVNTPRVRCVTSSVEVLGSMGTLYPEVILSV
jgi:hypothetical protein